MHVYSTTLYIIMVLLLAFFMIVNPQQSVEAARSGIMLWANTVLPALLPFFIVAELLVSLRFTQLLGILLEPLMRPLFHLPGCSALVIVMGFTSGFPVGAILTRKLYEEKQLQADEAEHLVSFTNNSSPLFILGAVGIGLLAHPVAGYILAISHYASNLCVGLFWRLVRKVKGAPYMKPSDRQASLASFFAQTESISIGKSMGEAIKNSLNHILTVGGFIVLFSVLTRMLSVWGFMDLLAHALSSLLSGLSYPLAYGLSMGLFEMTLGIKTASSSNAPLLAQLMVISIILSFSGFSVIAQVASILAGTPLRLSFYMLSRAIQIIISCILTWAGWIYLLPLQVQTATSIPLYKILYSVHAWQLSLYCLLIGLILMLIFFILSGIMYRRPSA